LLDETIGVHCSADDMTTESQMTPVVTIAWTARGLALDPQSPPSEVTKIRWRLWIC
jgi:hypothetical protein